MNKISVVIITKNEASNIARCIRSFIDVSDELIVLDSFSTDNTVSIAQKEGARVLQREWEGYSKSKNYVNTQAKYDYILSIDADEELSEELKQSIKIEKEKGLTGVYELNRLTNYCGKWIRRLGWHPDIKIRLFPKKKSYWEGDFVHETLKFDNSDCHVLEKKLLKGYLYHHSYVNFEQHRKKADHYSRLTAKKFYQMGKRTNIFYPYFSCFFRFLKMYILKLGFLEGYLGYKISIISAKSNIIKYKELYQIQIFKKK